MPVPTSIAGATSFRYATAPKYWFNGTSFGPLPMSVCTTTGEVFSVIVVMFAEVPAMVVSVALVETNVVMVPEVLVMLVNVALVETIFVMFAEVPLKLVMFALAPRNCVVAVVPNVVPVSVVMFALVTFKFVTVPDANVPSVVPVSVVIFALVPVNVVTVADVTVAFESDKLEIVRLVTARLVMFPEMPRIVEDAVVPIVVPVIVVMSADEPVSVVIAPDAPRNCVVPVVPKVVPVSVSMFALVEFKFVTVAEVDVRLVSVAEPAVNVVTLADAMLRLDRTRLVAVRFVIEADEIVARVKDAFNATISSTVIAAASWYAIVPKY
jgi:hypothetical protein